jgi:hypothetical protein
LVVQRIAENAPCWPDMNLAAEYEFEAPCRGCVAYRYRRVAAMTVLVEPFASVYDDRSRLGVILARGRSGFEAYAADDHSLGLFPSPRKAAAAITTTRPWVAKNIAENSPREANNNPSPLPRTGGGSTSIPFR